MILSNYCKDAVLPLQLYLIENLENQTDMKEKWTGFRKDNIAAFLKEYTEVRIAECNTDIPGLDASDIALGLSLDRANVSRDLNALYRDGVVIKILGKPTRYLHYHTVSEHFSELYIPNTIPIGQTLAHYVANESPIASTAMGGAQRITLTNNQHPSLWRAAVQAESAIHYPPHGLHTLLIGPYGSGKHEFAKQMFAYGKAIGKLSADAKLFFFDTHSFGNSAQTLMIQLFGCAAGVTSASSPSKKGLVERAEGSILLLSEIQDLPLSVQKKLIDLILHGTFTRFGEAAVSRQCKLMLVATCGNPCPDLQQAPLINYFPMQIALPPLSKRMVHERFLYLYQTFQAEAEALDCKTHVSKDVFYHLLCMTCSDDFITLRGTIKSICAMACREGFTDPYDRVFQIDCRHLPLSVLACSAAPALSADFHAVLDLCPQESVLIHSSSIPPQAMTLGKKISVQAGDFLPPSSSLLFVKNYMDEYLRSASMLQELRSEEHPLMSAHIYKNICKDPVLGTLSEHNVLIQGLASLLTETFHTDINYQLIEMPDEAAFLSKISTELRLMAVSLEADICRLFNQKSTSHRVSLIALYLYCVQKRLETSHIFVFFLFHGKGVSQGLAEYVGSLCNYSITPFHFDETSTSASLISEIDAAVSILPPESHLLFFSDGLPFQTLHTYIAQRYGFHVKGICGATFESILKTMRNVAFFHYTLDMIHCSQPYESETAAPMESAASIVRQAVHSVLAPSLTFLDVYKVSPLLEDSLAQINGLLALDYSDNISIRYQFHCAHMIERLIRKEPLHYPRLKAFFNLHSREFRAIGEALQPVAQTYGIKVPTSEIAYLVEIFLAI